MAQRELRFNGGRDFLALIRIFLLSCLIYTAQASIASIDAIEGLDLNSNSELSLSLDKKTVVFFLSAKCPCSKGHESYLKKLVKNPLYKNFNFIGINANLDEKVSFAQSYFQKTNFPFPVIRDKNQRFANELGALKTPHVYILDEKKKILYQGGVVNSRIPNRANLKHYLQNALNDIIEHKQPKVAKTRTLGCRIKR